MSDHGLTQENLLSALPEVLQKDPSASALAAAAAGLLAERPPEIDLLRLYAAIDRLEEPILSILAHDFKVDWWDAEYSLDEKRRTLKSNWLVHKRLGTKWAVTTALGAVFPGAGVREWFQYGGAPYCFRIEIPLPEGGVTAERQRRAVSRVWYYKNLRSHLDGIDLQAESGGFVRLGAYAAASAVVEVWPELVTGVEVTGEARAGGFASAKQAMEVFPQLTERVEAAARSRTSGMAAAHQTVEIYPE